MYQVESSTALLRARRSLVGRRTGPRVARTVLLLGLCSMLTDVSSEMVSAVLPLYLVTTLGFSPLQFGFVDGIYQGAGGLMRIAAGFVGDRFRRHKAVAVVGYGASAVCKLALAGIGQGVGAIGSVLLLDRAGKGIRTAPRDAMISLASPPGQLGAAFGVHRALDTTGALLGPLVAFGLLALAPAGYHMLFLVAFCFALAGLAVLGLLVDEPRTPRGRAGDPAGEAAPPVRLRDLRRMLGVPGLRPLIGAAVVLSLATASDAFIYLALQRHLALDSAVFPLLATGTSVTYMLLAAPAGRLADRIGRRRVFLGGYALLVLCYAAVAGGLPGLVGLAVILALLGCSYAATDGVLMALGSACVPDELRGSGLAVLGTASAGARLVASIGFGVLWTALGINATFACFGGGLLVALAVAAWALRSVR